MQTTIFLFKKQFDVTPQRFLNEILKTRCIILMFIMIIKETFEIQTRIGHNVQVSKLLQKMQVAKDHNSPGDR